MIEALLQKAIESGGQKYNPQQMAEMLDQVKLSLDTNLDYLVGRTVALERFSFILCLMIFGLAIWDLFLTGRLKKLEKKVLP